MAAFRTVCLVEDVPAGESRMLNLDGQMVGLFNVDGDFRAVSNECPHAGASLAHGTARSTARSSVAASTTGDSA